MEVLVCFSVSGCCWTANAEGKTNWTTQAELDLGTRSDSHAINRCPVTTTVSSLRYNTSLSEKSKHALKICSSLKKLLMFPGRIPQNCFTRVRLLAHDPDGDKVRCRFADGASAPTNTTLDEVTSPVRRLTD